MMGRTVVADHPGPVDGQRHRQLGDADIVDDLIERPLEEARVDGHHRPQALRGEAGGEGDGVLLGDADIEKPLRKLLGETVQTGAGNHRGRDGGDPVVAHRHLDHRAAEDLGVADRAVRRMGFAAGDVEGADPVIQAGIRFRRQVALALLGQHVDQHRPVDVVAHPLEGLDQVFQLMALDRADIVEFEGLEQHAGGEEALEALLALAQDVEDVLADIGQLSQPFLDVGLDPSHRLAGQLAAEETGEGADIRRDRHLVVVEDDDQVAVEVAGVVEGLEGEAGGHRAVADHRDGPVRLFLDVAGQGHAEGGRDRGRAVAGLEDVVAALLDLRKAADPLVLAQGGELVAATGEDLVGVGLVADIPDQLVLWGIEDVMQGDGQLDDAEARGEVAAGPGHRPYDQVAYFLSQINEIGYGEAADIGRRVDILEQRAVADACQCIQHGSGVGLNGDGMISRHRGSIITLPAQCLTFLPSPAASKMVRPGGSP